MGINPIRSAAAVVGGVLLLGFMDSTLERTLVGVIGQGTPATDAAYVAVRNRPMVLALTLATHALSSALAGYIIAKIAGAYEVRHALAAAVLLTAGYASTFVIDNAMLPPGWFRLAMLIVTPPVLAAGAHIRAEARAIQAEQAAAVPPEQGQPLGVPGDQKERR